MKKFEIVEPGLRSTIKVVELSENMADMDKESDKLKCVQEQLKIVTGGVYDPDDESCDISTTQAGELIRSFLLGQTPS